MEPQKWQKNTKDIEYSLLFPFVPLWFKLNSLCDYLLKSKGLILKEIRELQQISMFNEWHFPR
jgi:hypothetical protein